MDQPGEGEIAWNRNVLFEFRNTGRERRSTMSDTPSSSRGHPVEHVGVVRLPQAIFACVSGSEISENDRASLPVPAVVRTAIMGSMALPTPQ